MYTRCIRAPRRTRYAQRPGRGLVVRGFRKFWTDDGVPTLTRSRIVSSSLADYERSPIRLRGKLEFGARVYPIYGRGLVMPLGWPGPRKKWLIRRSLIRACQENDRTSGDLIPTKLSAGGLNSYTKNMKLGLKSYYLTVFFCGYQYEPWAWK